MAGEKKVLHLGHRVRYPITITKLFRSAGDKIKKQQPLLSYSYKWMKEVGDPFGTTWQEEQTTLVDWDSPADGKISSWEVSEGDVVARDQPCLTVEEECSHEIQFQGLCAICGKDMTVVDWASETRDTARAPINMTHDQTSLTVSELAAARAEHELQRRLLAQRKLSLVVDLDQTIIHACIEPTVGEWQRDPSNPNYDAVKDVRSFQLSDEGAGGPRGIASGCWYYIKLRPGLLEFLDRISNLYELHVYTMGTRAYALNIAKLVDPDQRLFANRVISRDENGSMTAKSLQRLFPVNTHMVVIIDDRADVWPRNRPNLIKVTPYDFFKGIGDINSSFLPKREDLLAPSPAPAEAGSKKDDASLANAQTAPNGPPSTAKDASASKVSAIEELVSMSGGDDTALRKKQAEEQERTLEQQIKDRPLLHLQEKLEKEDEEAAERTTVAQEPSDSSSEEAATQPIQQQAPQRHHQLLFDDDTELQYLERHLTSLHTAYYEEHDADKPESQKHPTAHAGAARAPSGRRGSAAMVSMEEAVSIPDVGVVLDRLKAQVLAATTIVLSGLVPLGVDVLRSEIGLQAQSFGAEIQTKINKKVTHLVISSNRPRTQKVRQAAKIPSIKIVNQDWLAECLRTWVKVDETPYLIDIHPADRLNAPAGQSQDTTDAETVSDIDTDDSSNRRRLKIVVSTPGGGGRQTVDQDGNSDEDSEAGANNEDEGLDFDMDGPGSPIDDLKTFDWGGAEEEMNEFLASGSDDDDDDDDDGDGDSQHRDGDWEAGEGQTQDGSDHSTQGHGSRQLRASPPGTKRKHEDDTDSDMGDSAIPESLLAKKQRLARSRGASGLRVVRTPEGARNSLPTPQVTGDEEEVLLLNDKTTAAGGGVGGGGGDGDGGDDDVDIDDDDLEADLMAELEAEEQQEKG